jgi:hypothetical protein
MNQQMPCGTAQAFYDRLIGVLMALCLSDWDRQLRIIIFGKCSESGIGAGNS